MGNMIRMDDIFNKYYVNALLHAWVASTECLWVGRLTSSIFRGRLALMFIVSIGQSNATGKYLIFLFGVVYKKVSNANFLSCADAQETEIVPPLWVSNRDRLFLRNELYSPNVTG